MNEFSSRVIGGALTLTIAADMLLPASAPSDPLESSPASIEQIEQTTTDHDSLAELIATLPTTPCDQMQNRADPLVAAAACEAVQQHTRIALVNFDFTAAEANTVADGIKGYINLMSGSTFHAEPLVIPASETAKKTAAEARGPDNCIREKTEFASLAAQKTMPELAPEKVDYVVALTNAVNCGSKKVGEVLAIPARYADLFVGRVTDPKIRMSKLPLVAAHEIGHLLGLGHVFTLSCQDAAYPEGVQVLSPNSRGLLDLAEYLKVDKHESPCLSKGARYIMGPAASPKRALAAPQLPDLMWPQITREGPAASPGKVVTKEGIVISPQEALRDKYARVMLSQAISLPIGEVSADTMKVTPMQVQELAIVPNPCQDTSAAVFCSAELMLRTGSNELFLLGSLGVSAAGEDVSGELRAGDQLVTIHLTDDQLVVSQK